MGSPSACKECGKKFKVFGIKKKCKYCMDIMCKTCLTDHLELKHTHSSRSSRLRMSLDTLDNASDHEQLQFLSTAGPRGLNLESSSQNLPLGGDEVVSDEEDDDYLDYEDDELFIKTLSRQSSIEELELKCREMYNIQTAVATWAMKEKKAKMDMKRNKRNSSMCPVFPEGWDHEHYNMLAGSYAIVVTLLVWAVYGLLLFLYLDLRSKLTSFFNIGCIFN